MKVKDIISNKILTVDKDQTISTGLKIMEKNHVSRLNVIDNGKLVGIVTLSDIASRLGSAKTSTVPTSGLHISGVMSSNPFVVQEKMGMVEAAKLMVEKKVSGLPVVDKNGDLKGILVKKDFIKKCSKIRKIKIKNIMTKDPEFVSTSTRLLAARDILLRKKISTLPVYEHGKVVGIISNKLIAKALAIFRNEVPGRHISEQIRQLLVGKHMLPDAPTILANKSIAEAAKLLEEEYIHALPVVTKQGNIIGILSRGDLVKIVAEGKLN
ncbi:MAG: CBS domain-containing protein [Candidatus Ranarchaeia archaeon]